MKPLTTTTSAPFRLSPTAAGAMYCIVAVLGYSAANVCMRELSKSCLPAWAVCNKELVTVLIAGPWLAWQVWRRKTELPRGFTLAVLIAAGLSTELIGNIGTQWGYGVVGLAVMIPANTASVLVATAVLGAVLLGERVSARNATVLALLIAALLVLGYGILQAGRQTGVVPAAVDAVVAKPPLEFWLIAVAIAVSCACGTVFALLAIALRYAVNGRTSLSAAVVIITGSGVVTLGPLSLWQAGPQALAAIPLRHYELMYAAGAFNFVAFICLVRGLQLTTALHINMINNAGQVSLAAVAGVLLFNEPCNPWILLGVGLMIAGIFAIEPPVSEGAIEAPV